MARGNDSTNKTKSPFIPEGNITASPDEISVMTEQARDIFAQSVKNRNIDLHNPEEVTQAVLAYFDSCQARGLRPGNLGMYAALGLSRQDVNNAITGKSKTLLSPASIDVLKKAIRAIGAFREQLGSQGKINPVTMIFWQKNYDGLEDNTRVEVMTQASTPVTITAEEARAALVDSIPDDESV